MVSIRLPTALLMLGLSGFLINLSLYANKTKIKFIDDLELMSVPSALKQHILEDKYFTNLVLIEVRNSTPHYLYRVGNRENINYRALILKDKLSSLAAALPHGLYVISLDDGVHSQQPWPLLAFAATKNLVASKNVFLIPDAHAIRGYNKIFAKIKINRLKYPWSKKKSIIFWRGASTGFRFTADKNLDFPRGAFLAHVKNLSYVDAGFNQYIVKNDKEEKLSYLQKNFPLTNTLGEDKSLAYKYLIDIDGNSCSYSRTAWILYSNSLLLKHQSDKIQWYYSFLRPKQNYLPINNDFSNLEEQYKWAQAHPQEVQKMIKQANLLVNRVFTKREIDRAIISAFIDYQNYINGMTLSTS